MDENTYIKPSPILSDNGEKIGVASEFLSFRQLEALGHPKSPLKAIRANCIDCCGGSLSEVRKCTVFRCPVWPMRDGLNPFHAQSKHSQNKEKAPSATNETEAFSENHQTKEVSNET